jgi:hypothetical protein
MCEIMISYLETFLEDDLTEIEEYALECIESYPESLEEAWECFRPIYPDDRNILEIMFDIYASV